MRNLTQAIYIICRCTHIFYARELKKLHLTMGQFPFLMEIVDNDGISQEKLSSQLKISKSTTAVIVRQLLESGLITRKPDEKDRRNFHLHATEKARNLIPGIEKIIDLCHSTILQDLTDEEWAAAHQAVEQALTALVDFRRQEGAALEMKFREKIANISALLSEVEPYEQERVGKIKDRITETLEKTLSVDYDKNRLEQELIYYIEKLDINEEKQRLANHLRYFIETLEGGHGQGKKLGFIAQEMGREINTLGSKSNHAEMQKIVVRMKDELEQIKEQVLNVM